MQRAVRRRIKEDMTKTSYHTIERFIAGISTENIDLLSEAEIELLFNAAKKAGTPAWSLEHAQRIMADNIYAFRPPHGSPFENSNTTWLAMKHWPRRPPPTAEDFDNAARAVYAAWMEQRALEVIKLGLSELPEAKKPAE
jgi:hypothetical protein